MEKKLKIETVAYEEGLKERLRTPGYAAAYVQAALKESPDAFLLALRDVADAVGISKIAKESKLNRSRIYTSLSETGNPVYRSLVSILGSVGLELDVRPKKRPVSSPKVSKAAARR